MKQEQKHWVRYSVRCLVFLATLLAGPTALGQGSLVIAGGAIRDDNEALYRAFLERVATGKGPLLIIAAASGRPASSGASMRERFAALGFDQQRIAVLPLALVDDPGTEGVDESEWRRNAWAPEVLRQASDAVGVWFTGGDQMRIVSVLRDEQGDASPLLELIRARYAAGAVVGGTSAGAAVMSRSMITGGDSFTALTEPEPGTYSVMAEQESGRLSMAAGLGFLAGALVDQHFDRKARLGRLVRAMALSGDNLGLGVDEDTALLVDFPGARGSVVGAGTVTVVNATGAVFDFAGPKLARGLTLSLYPVGARFDVTSGALHSAPGSSTVAAEYYSHAVRAGGGMAFPNPSLEQVLGHDLLDNSAARSLQRWSVDAGGTVLIYRFEQLPASRGYWHDGEGGSRYTLGEVGFEIERRQLQLR